MNACELLCLPSTSEGVPNVLLEAMACGRPVVATRVGGVAEIVPVESCGIFVPPRDSTGLASAMTEALERQWDRDAIVTHAGRFSWEDNADRVCSVLKAAA
jgi:glycosyltransferase involved in cell wall biosynthesis